MRLNVLYPIICFLSIWNFAFSTKHCPALSLDFADFGIDDCSPSFLFKTPEDAARLLLRSKCLGFGEWTLPASVGCSSPVLTVGLHIQFPCGCDFGEGCKVQCKHDYKLIGNDTIVCLQNGSYSILPKCERETCLAPVLPQNVNLAPNCQYKEGSDCSVTCSSAEYKLQGKSSITCDHGQWSEFPVCLRFCLLSNIPAYLKISPECEGRENEFCAVACQNARLRLNGPKSLQCTGQWSIFPTCGCTEDDVPHRLKLLGTCQMVAGEYCDADCDHEYYKKGDNGRIFCDANGEWDATPLRSIQCWKKCGEPRLSSGLVFETPCLRATVGEECRVKCLDKTMKLAGSNTFRCLETGVYSGIAACAESQKCSQSLVPNTVKFAPDCLNIVGETCSISCVNPIAILEGPSSITCLASGAWDALVECVVFCPPLPEVPQYQPTNCQRVRENTYCDVKCLPGHNPLTTHYVKCLEGGRWPDRMPKCSVDCGFPPLGRDVEIAECEHGENDTCFVSCNNGNLRIHPEDTFVVKCLPSGQWSHKPECLPGCGPKLLPKNVELVEFYGACLMPLALNQVCKARCKKNDEALEFDEIICTDAGFRLFEELRRYPVCHHICGPFVLPSHLEYAEGPCLKIFSNQQCPLKCKNPRAVLKTDMFCREGSWMPFPACVINCPSPIVPWGTKVEGFCTFLDGDRCKLVCSNSADLFSDNEAEHYITCRNGKWVGGFPCFKACPRLGRPSYSKPFRVECRRLLGSVCIVLCMERYKVVGSPTVTCTKTGWTKTPECVPFCELPDFPPHMVLAGSCSSLVNLSCKLMCLDNTRLEGPDTIYCVPVDDPRIAAWTRLGQCVPNN